MGVQCTGRASRLSQSAVAVVAETTTGRLDVGGGPASFAVQMEQQHVETGQARAPTQEHQGEDKDLEATRRGLHFST